jgi:hypothetical protein
MSRDVGKCELCGAECKLTKHHLRPQVRCKNKYKEIKEDPSNIAWICEACHQTVHAFYTENELRDNYASISALKSASKFKGYLKWRAKHLDENVKPSKMANRRK